MFILTVVGIWIVAVVTPGPNFFLLLKIGLSGPRDTAAFAAAGTIAGTLCWGLAGWLGIGALFAAAPVAYMTLKVAGGLYLVWLGLKLFRQMRAPEQTIDIAPASELSPFAAWRRGFLTNLANPKSALFVASLFASAMTPGTPWLHGAAAVAAMTAISTIWYGGLVMALGHPAVGRAYRRTSRRIDSVAGTIFVGFGLTLALSDR
ncbi:MULTISPECIES: LysE family transporter [unclassified Ensifer]|uniref:LysE family transporter n=1 Tax=unclassified Ensifer TaxID=2633371 RepID=UPI0007159418|nr:MULTISPECIES: LysE family transporter [unclassified Ensifer]OWZ90504.1 lysine transporter LysE [Sinorhizobium sp. LM21]KQX52510.1 lysine transporter LysE [Ensifer sp. Root1298]KQX85355.1 lysine transporter LysE [Ensifer sp. Root1312]KRC18964.1 lysine transporter LysE [Ensifer sp. Root74]KRD76777.1 lysine transporter LysE [Ensifer sp. Root954]